MGTTRTLPPGWTVSTAAPWRVHRRWVTNLGRQTVGRRLRRVILGQAAPGIELDSISFDLEDIVLGILGWALKVVFIVLVVPIVLLVVLVVGLLEVLGRLLLRRPWAVDAFGRDGTQLRWREPGARRARARRDELRPVLAAGAAPPGAELVTAGAA